MKSSLFLTAGAALIMLTSIQTFASDLSGYMMGQARFGKQSVEPSKSNLAVLVNDLKTPVKFKFSEEISLKPSRNDKNILSAFVNATNTYGSDLEVVPGLSLIQGHEGCYIQKQVADDDVRSARISAGSSQWTIKLINRELIIRKVSSQAALSPTNYSRPVAKLYREEFELKSEHGVKVQLICNMQACTEKSYAAEPKCDDKLTNSTAKLLKKLGVDPVMDIEELAFKKSAKNDIFKMASKSIQKAQKKEATAQ